MKDLQTRFISWILICCTIIFMGCKGPEKGTDSSFLIKSKSMSINTSDFLEELDLKRVAYPYDIDENSVRYNEMVMDLVQTLSNEILLLTAAADKGVTITNQEIIAAEDEFKKDYREGSFEQILLKNAISYSLWKKRFMENMIMDKFIDQELKQKIEITPQGIVTFYKKHQSSYNQKNHEYSFGLNPIDNEKKLVSHLRLQKAQDHYDDWMQKLLKEYPVQINKEKLKTFLIDIEKSEGSKHEKEN